MVNDTYYGFGYVSSIEMIKFAVIHAELTTVNVTSVDSNHPLRGIRKVDSPAVLELDPRQARQHVGL